MTKAIWKYTLEVTTSQEISMPLGAKIVHVASQLENPAIWAIVDPLAPKVKRRFGVLTTGASFDPVTVTYLGSFMLHGGTFVGHIVEPNPRMEILPDPRDL